MINIDEHFVKMKCIQTKLLDFIESESNIEEYYDNLIKTINDENILHDHFKFKSLLILLSRITKNHIREAHFILKIQKILSIIKNEIKNIFSNFEIFNIFKNNKIMLLFLIEEKIIIIDNSIANIMTQEKNKNRKYPEFFFPEIQPFINEDGDEDEEKNNLLISSNFEENRRIGENESLICKLIRNDSIEDFIIYINKNDISLQTKIEQSIYETNSLLLKENPTLIEYSAFFGSFQIFKYLYLNNATTTPRLWTCAIHGNNPELISYFEDNGIESDNIKYNQLLDEAIKCHHCSLANYILDNLINENDKITLNEMTHFSSFHYHNYLYFPDDLNNYYIFFYACHFNHIEIVKYFLQNKQININNKIIII